MPGQVSPYWDEGKRDEYPRAPYYNAVRNLLWLWAIHHAGNYPHSS